MNPMDYMKFAGMWQQFTSRHPKFAAFLQAMMQNKVQEGTIFEVSVKTPDGQNICTNLKITAEDMALFQELKNMRQ